MPETEVVKYIDYTSTAG